MTDTLLEMFDVLLGKVRKRAFPEGYHHYPQPNSCLDEAAVHHHSNGMKISFIGSSVDEASLAVCS